MISSHEYPHKMKKDQTAGEKMLAVGEVKFRSEIRHLVANTFPFSCIVQIYVYSITWTIEKEPKTTKWNQHSPISIHLVLQHDPNERSFPNLKKKQVLEPHQTLRPPLQNSKLESLL